MAFHRVRIGILGQESAKPTNKLPQQYSLHEEQGEVPPLATIRVD